MTKLIWKSIPDADPNDLRNLVDFLSTSEPFPQILAKILLDRGVKTPKEARAFLRPNDEALHSPFLMKDMEKASQRIYEAILNKEKILVYGDYDVDGTSSVSLFSLVLADWGANFDMYIPDRYTEGYGLSFKGVDYAKENQAKLLITLDCGTKAVDKVAMAKAAGIDVIICDHHTPGAQPPEYFAMVNPRQPECEYPFKDLPAAGLALKLLEAIHHKLLINKGLAVEVVPLLSQYADLVALSICCDIVPMHGENRIITSLGLSQMRSNPIEGLGALIKLSETERAWTVSDVLFFLGPRINAAGRLYHALKAVKVLLGDTRDLDQFAMDLHKSNEERKALDQKITSEALSEIESSSDELSRKSTVLTSDSWHKGVIGIVASRLIEKHFRPTVLLTKSGDHLVGSGRSVPGFDLYAALESCEEHLIQFGGHKYAAGLTLKPENFEAFKEAFETYVSANLTEEQKRPILPISGELAFDEITPRFMRRLKLLAPFGPSNREPVFFAAKVKVQNYRILKDVHLRLTLSHSGIVFEAIGFNLAETWLEEKALELDIAFQPSFKTWRGVTSIQLQLKDLRPSES